MAASIELSQLTERGEQIVDLMSRFRLITATALVMQYPTLSSDAARKVLERQVSDGWSVKHQFPGGGTYFVLSSKACNRLNLKRNALALRQRTLVQHCLALYYFAARPHLRLLTSHECKEHLPAIYRRGSARHFFIDSETDSLGRLCLDDGKAPARVRTKTTEVAAKCRLIPELHELARQKKFRVVVLTSTTSAAEKLTQLFADQPVRNVQVEIAAVRQCQELSISGM